MKTKLLVLALCSFYHLHTVAPKKSMYAQILTVIDDEQNNINMMGPARKVLVYLCDRKAQNLDSATKEALQSYNLIGTDGELLIEAANFSVRYQHTWQGLRYTVERNN